MPSFSSSLLSFLPLFTLTLSLPQTPNIDPIDNYTPITYLSGPRAKQFVPWAAGAGDNLISYVNMTSAQVDFWYAWAKQPTILQNLTTDASKPANYFPPNYSRTASGAYWVHDDNPYYKGEVAYACAKCADDTPGSNVTSNADLFNLAPADPNWSQIWKAALYGYQEVVNFPRLNTSPFKFALAMYTGGGGDNSSDPKKEVCSTVLLEGLQMNSQSLLAQMPDDLANHRLSGITETCRCGGKGSEGGMASSVEVLTLYGTPRWRLMIQSGGPLCVGN